MYLEQIRVLKACYLTSNLLFFSGIEPSQEVITYSREPKQKKLARGLLRITGATSAQNGSLKKVSPESRLVDRVAPPRCYLNSGELCFGK